MNNLSNDNHEAIKAKLLQARAYITAGEIDRARDYLLGLIDQGETSEDMWWLFATISDGDDQQISLEHVLDLNPNHQEAWDKLLNYNRNLYYQYKLSRRLEANSYNVLLPHYRDQIENLFNALIDEEKTVLSEQEKAETLDFLIANLAGFGALEPLLRDEAISFIFVQNENTIYAMHKRQWQKSSVQFDGELHFIGTISRIRAQVGNQLNEQSTTFQARWTDGSHVTILTPPNSVKQPLIMIKKPRKYPLLTEDLIRFGSITPEISEFLRGCVIAGLNILVAGDADSGKSTLANALSDFIPHDERIITLERLAEYQLRQEHVVSIESKASFATILLHHRPDRLIFGELMADEMLPFVDTALATSVMGTICARSAEATLLRMESALLKAIPNSTIALVRNLISRAIHIIVLMRLYPDGTRKIAQIGELTATSDGTYNYQPIFQYEQTALERGKLIGRLRPTGYVPKTLKRLEEAEINLPPLVFGPAY